MIRHRSVPSRHSIVLLLLVATLAHPVELYGLKMPSADLRRPVLHFRFDEPGGRKALDSSPTRNHAILAGGIRRSGGSVVLDGVSGHLIARGHRALDSIRDGISVSAWVSRTAAGSSGYLAIVGRRFGPGPDDLWSLFYNAGTKAEYGFGVRTSNGPLYVYGPSSNADVDAWTHVAGVYDGATVTLYRNGIAIASARHNGAIPTERTPVLVGAGDNGAAGVGEFLAGRLDDVRVYAQPLSPQQVLEVMEAERPLSGATARTLAGHGPTSTRTLRVHPENPRYFTDGSGKAVYLTGSHTWNSLVDGGGADSEPLADFNYERYLDLLQSYGHNFIRMWTRESGSRFDTEGDRLLFRLAPTIWRRAGAGQARDGGPKFDLGQLNPAYFNRLRDRVVKARRRNLYVGIMLFEGFSVEAKGVPDGGDPWPGHPFHRDNNINGIDGDPGGDGKGRSVHTLETAAITRYQTQYVRRVVDTLNDLDNVIYEVCNECAGSAANARWQEYIANTVRGYEGTKARQHPVWMTVPWPSGQDRINVRLLASTADAISPGFDPDESRPQDGDFRWDPPASDGTKVVLTDTDHLWGIGGSVEWVWKSFARGLNPLFMDPLVALTGNPKYPDVSDAHALRAAMGHTRRYAERMDLARMLPQGSDCSTGYCLVSAGSEYLVYQPEPGQTFTVNLPAGEYMSEWFDPITGLVRARDPIHSAGGRRAFAAPWKGPAVLYLKVL